MVDDKKYEGKGSSKNTDSKITDTPQKLDSNSETLTLFETKVQTYFTGQDKPYDSGLARQLLTELKVTTETLSLLSVEDFANKLMNYDGKTNGTNGNGQTYAMIVDKLGGSKARLILNAREDIEKDFWKDMEDYENLPEEQKRDLRTQYLTLVGSRANFAQGQKIQENQVAKEVASSVFQNGVHEITVKRLLTMDQKDVKNSQEYRSLLSTVSDENRFSRKGEKVFETNFLEMLYEKGRKEIASDIRKSTQLGEVLVNHPIYASTIEALVALDGKEFEKIQDDSEHNPENYKTLITQLKANQGRDMSDKGFQTLVNKMYTEVCRKRGEAETRAVATEAKDAAINASTKLGNAWKWARRNAMAVGLVSTLLFAGGIMGYSSLNSQTGMAVANSKTAVVKAQASEEKRKAIELATKAHNNNTYKPTFLKLDSMNPTIARTSPLYKKLLEYTRTYEAKGLSKPAYQSFKSSLWDNYLKGRAPRENARQNSQRFTLASRLDNLRVHPQRATRFNDVSLKYLTNGDTVKTKASFVPVVKSLGFNKNSDKLAKDNLDNLWRVTVKRGQHIGGELFELVNNKFTSDTDFTTWIFNEGLTPEKEVAHLGNILRKVAQSKKVNRKTLAPGLAGMLNEINSDMSSVKTKGVNKTMQGYRIRTDLAGKWLADLKTPNGTWIQKINKTRPLLNIFRNKKKALLKQISDENAREDVNQLLKSGN